MLLLSLIGLHVIHGLWQLSVSHLGQNMALETRKSIEMAMAAAAPYGPMFYPIELFNALHSLCLIDVHQTS